MLPAERAERRERLQRVTRTIFIIHARTYVVVNVFLGGLFWILHLGFVFWIVAISWGLALVLHGMATFARSANND